MVEALQAHSGGDYAFAGPDSPQIYFLADLRNPTRSLFDFLDTTDSARGNALIQRLAATGVTAVVLNTSSTLSSPLDTRTLGQLAKLYPRAERIGRYQVRWVDPAR